MSKRKIIASVATSADGYIARRDGNVDWLNARTDPAGDYGMKAFFESIDTILWGRKTYEKFVAMKNAPSFGPTVKNYVFTRRLGRRAKKGFEYAREGIPDFAQRLRAEPGKDIWMMGGGGLIASFLDAGELDEFMINVIPVFIGKGILLIEPKKREIGLELVRSHAYPDGVVTLHYKVSR